MQRNMMRDMMHHNRDSDERISALRTWVDNKVEAVRSEQDTISNTLNSAQDQLSARI